MNIKLDEIIARPAGKTIYKSGGYCVKLFDETYKKSDVLNEALNQARVEETGLPISVIQGVTMIDGKWAIVFDYIEGVGLDKLIEENPSKINDYLEKFVELQLQIHSQKCPLLTKLRDKMHRKISASRLDATTRYELHHLLDGMPKHDKLCHGDFTPENIIVRPDGKWYIIDWAHATQGNASAGAAMTYLLFCLGGSDELAKQYLNLFCKKSDTAKQYVQKWIPIVAASRLTKNKPEEKAFLQKWATVVDYE